MRWVSSAMVSRAFATVSMVSVSSETSLENRDESLSMSMRPAAKGPNSASSRPVPPFSDD